MKRNSVKLKSKSKSKKAENGMKNERLYCGIGFLASLSLPLFLSAILHNLCVCVCVRLLKSRNEI